MRCVLFLGAILAAQDKLTLEWKFKPGDAWTLRAEGKIEAQTENGARISVEVTCVGTLEVKAAGKKGKAAGTLAFTDGKVTATARGDVSVTKLEEGSIPFTITKRGKINFKFKRADVPEETKDYLELLLDNLWTELPKEAVEKGKSWSEKRDVPGWGGKGASSASVVLKNKLKKIDVHDGKKAAWIVTKLDASQGAAGADTKNEVARTVIFAVEEGYAISVEDTVATEPGAAGIPTLRVSRKATLSR